MKIGYVSIRPHFFSVHDKDGFQIAIESPIKGTNLNEHIELISKKHFDSINYKIRNEGQDAPCVHLKKYGFCPNEQNITISPIIEIFERCQNVD